MTGFLNQLNEQVDPSQHRFKIKTTFNLVPKPGLTEVTKFEDLAAAPATNGKFALFEFTDALPRAMLFGSWRVNTNDAATLEELRNPNFDPAQSVFVANELPQAPHATNSPTAGTVQFAGYEPKFIQLRADATAPAVLLLNDRFHPHWKAWVDGRPAPVLRCNYILRGVYLTPGKHEVEFRFQPPLTALYISLASFVAGVGLCCFLAVSSLRKEAPAARPAPKPATAAQH